MTSGSLWNYYRDEIDDVDDNASDVKSLEYRTKIKGIPRNKKHQIDLEIKEMQIDNQCQLKSVEVTVSFRYLSNF